MKLAIAKGAGELPIESRMANRHGLIAGATGTGKTITLQVIAEKFSSIGVPIFMADVKGDLSGMSKPGAENPKIKERVAKLGIPPLQYKGCPVCFWDLFGQQGHPIRATVSDMGPLFLSRILALNDTQTGVMNVVFKVADEQGLLLLDLKDLKAMLDYVAKNAKDFNAEFGLVSAASVGAIQRSILTLEQQGAEPFFGEPMLDIMDMIKCDASGSGIVNILAADKLLQSPALYSTFLLWLLGELYEKLPEVGDLDKPKILFFFDEAHLLFSDAPKTLLDKIEQVVRLIRSKGVGIWFVTQNPLDIPDIVLGQLGNRVQHALRAFTPRDQKAVKAAAETFRANPKVNVETVIGELGVGEALISFLDDSGTPAPVDRAFIYPPSSQIVPVTPDERNVFIRGETLFGKYEQSVDRESAYELLAKKAQQQEQQARQPQSFSGGRQSYDYGYEQGHTRRSSSRGSSSGGFLQSVAKGATSSLGRTVGRELVRGLFGALLKG